MSNIENIFICLSAPLFIGAICAGRKYYHGFVFVILGYVACLVSAYANTFFAKVYYADVVTASLEIAPVVEEIVKLLPVLFYLLVYHPNKKSILLAIFAVGTGFATMENTYYLVQSGANNMFYLLVRSMGSGSMHIICGAIIGYGLIYIWEYPWLKFPGTFGLLCGAICYHALYNLMISSGGTLEKIGILLPLLTVLLTILTVKRLKIGALQLE